MLAGRRLLAGMCHFRAVCLGEAVKAVPSRPRVLLAGVVLFLRLVQISDANGIFSLRSKTDGTYSAVRAGSVFPGAFPGKKSLGFYLLSPLEQ